MSSVSQMNLECLMEAYCLWDIPNINFEPKIFDNCGHFNPRQNEGFVAPNTGFNLPGIDPEAQKILNDPSSMGREELYFNLLKGYKYETVSYYDDDKQKTIDEYKCGEPGCGKLLQKPWNLLDHVRMHAGIKPYKCQWCGKGFTQKGNLKKHARQHIRPDVNERKRYSCRLCNKGYTERYNLKVN